MANIMAQVLFLRGAVQQQHQQQQPHQNNLRLRSNAEKVASSARPLPQTINGIAPEARQRQLLSFSTLNANINGNIFFLFMHARSNIQLLYIHIKAYVARALEKI